FEIKTTAGKVRARTICACDGATSRTAKFFGFERNKLGFCLEGAVACCENLTEADRHRAVFNLSCIRDGYAWSFPRGDEFAVGVGSASPMDTGLLEVLNSFINRTPELKGRDIQKVKGGMIPDFTGPKAYYARGGVYLAGDAACLVDPLTGEGIYYAIRSGRLAAQAILGGGEDEYEKALQDEILVDLMAAHRFSRRFRFVPHWLRKVLMCTPYFTRRADDFVRLFTGQISYRDLA
ncbi:MAG: NAD(P)/FAD-dependent oxidoreductase, partial [Planctomycetes bacterium]|nr:NAD(P)/FAD-dependent oxidoreductase [Planctomycetota bacterium]